MYVKITNGSVDTYPYSVGKLRRDNPNTSFPKQIPTEVLANWGVYPVAIAENPEYDPLTHKIEQADAPTLVDGTWTLTKAVVALSADEIQAATMAQAAAVRATRDAKLAQTDWMALSDVTMSEAVANYRQALRDITAHENFPYLDESDWPAKPE